MTDIVIPLGGKGRRFADSSRYSTCPKPLIDVCGKPLICYVIDAVKGDMLPEDTLSIFYDQSLDNDNFANVISTRYPFVNLVKLPRASKGAADTVRMCLSSESSDKPTQHRPILLLDCDTFYSCDILAMARRCRTPAIFYFEDSSYPPIYSYVSLSDAGIVSDIQEKTKISDFACSGAYFFSDQQQLLEYCEKVVDAGITFKGEYYTSCVVKCILDDGFVVQGVPLPPNTCFMLGTPQQVDNYLEHVRGFLCDLDGTLIVSDHVYADVWCEIMADLGVDMSHERFKKDVRGKNDSTALSTLLPDASDSMCKMISARKDELFCKYMNRSSVVPGALEFMALVKRQGHKLCVVTNCNRQAAEGLLSTFGMSKFVDELIVGNECERPKPYGDPYRVAMQKIGLPASRCVVFEDSETGIISARRAGIDFVTVIGSRDYPDFLGMLDFKSLATEQQKRHAALEKTITASLASCHSLHNAKVYIDPSLHLEGNIAQTTRVWIEDTASQRIVTAIAKIRQSGSESMHSIMSERLHLYEREQYFYEKIQPYTYSSVKSPKFIAPIFDPDTLLVAGVLIEYIDSLKDVTMCPALDSMSIVAATVTGMADLHAKFMDRDLHLVFPSLVANDRAPLHPFMSNFVRDRWDDFRSKWFQHLNVIDTAALNIVAEKFEEIQLYLSSDACPSRTLVHGDIKSLNMCFDNRTREPIFFDWQYLSFASGAQDLVFLMIESLESSFLDEHAEDIIHTYVSRLRERGAKLTRQQFNRDFVAACAFFPFFVCVWFGTTPESDLVDVAFPRRFISKYVSFLRRFRVGDALTTWKK